MLRKFILLVSHQESNSSLKAMMLFFGLLIFTAIFGTLLCGLWYGHFTVRDTQLEGLETSAILEEKYTDNVNQYIHYWFTYRFTTRDDDTYLSSIEVSAEIYTQYEVNTVLLLRYQAENPSFNSLDILNTDLNQNLRSMLILSAVVIGFVMILSVSLYRSAW